MNGLTPSRWHHPLSLRGGQQDDAAILRVSQETDEIIFSVTEGQWIATGVALPVVFVMEGTAPFLSK